MAKSVMLQQILGLPGKALALEECKVHLKSELEPARM